MLTEIYLLPDSNRYSVRSLSVHDKPQILHIRGTFTLTAVKELTDLKRALLFPSLSLTEHFFYVLFQDKIVASPE